MALIKKFSRRAYSKNATLIYHELKKLKKSLCDVIAFLNDLSENIGEDASFFIENDIGCTGQLCIQLKEQMKFYYLIWLSKNSKKRMLEHKYTFDWDHMVYAELYLRIKLATFVQNLKIKKDWN